VVDEDEIEKTIARIKKSDSKVKAWRMFSSINSANCPPIGEFHNAAQPLKNLTVGVKDIIDVAGLPTRMGSAIFEDAAPAAKDATCVERMRGSGAIIIGKTVTTELASFVPSETRNPLNLAHTPGGSSSGSAAAVAAWHVDIAIGTQTAGSILRPAAYCGVIGFKPSFGLVATDGVLIQSPTLDTVGVFARSFEYCAAWLSAMTGQTIALENNGKLLRLAIINNWDHLASAATREAIQVCKKRLIKAGHLVHEIALPEPLASMPRTQKIIQDVEAARAYKLYRTVYRDKLTPGLAEILDQGAAIDEASYIQALVERKNAITVAAQMLGEVDAWLVPSAPSEALRGFTTTGDPIFNRLASGLGLPALSLPILTKPEALPLGLQIVGSSGSDASLLKIAARISQSIQTLAPKPLFLL
jgi:Asp-tRNA(Asn)/Glu-tRNA(Gln) amidotransferase A subunit family amidase